MRSSPFKFIVLADVFASLIHINDDLKNFLMPIFYPHPGILFVVMGLEPSEWTARMCPFRRQKVLPCMFIIQMPIYANRSIM
jgi:hypothetical protein